MNRPPRSNEPNHSNEIGLKQRMNSLRAAAANWLMPAESKGFDGSLESCSDSKLWRAPEPSENTDLIRTEHDEHEVIWLTRLVAVVASGVLTMLIWLFTPLGW